MRHDRVEILTVQDLRPTGVSPAEAAALVSGIADLLIAARESGEAIALPSEEDILVAATGEISFARVTALKEPPDHVPALALLLRRMLDLDSSSRPRNVPGSLMVLMARAVGEIDLPRPVLHAFRDALVRVAPDARAARAGLVASRLTLLAPPIAPTRPANRWQWRPATLAFAAGALSTILVTSYDPTAGPQRTPAPTARPAAPPATLGAPAPGVRRQPGPVTGPRDGGPQDHRRAATAPLRAPQPATRSAVRLLLAEIDGTEPFSPSFSADGRSIYFHTGRDKGRLMRADLATDGTVARIQPLLSDNASNFHVVPSPDGTMVAFDSDRDGVRAVYVADADGSHARRISGLGFGAVPTWSPDGRTLAFVKADVNPRTWNVWVADVPTGALRQVSHHRSGQAWGASWFPDGRRLAYSREDQLLIVDLASGRRTIIQSPRVGQLVRTPSVSPDGTRVVFQVHKDGVWVLDVAQGRISRVSTDRSAEEFRWSPDGRRIAYHARNGRRWGVWTLGAAS